MPGGTHDGPAQRGGACNCTRPRAGFRWSRDAVRYFRAAGVADAVGAVPAPASLKTRFRPA